MGIHVNVSNLLPVGIKEGERTASAWPCYFAGQLSPCPELAERGGFLLNPSGVR